MSLLIQVDVIVNSINAELRLDGGEVSNALLDIAGETLQEECDSIAPDGIEVGEVVVTSGGQLECQHVVHGACCGWGEGEETCTEVIVNQFSFFSMPVFLTYCLLLLCSVLCLVLDNKHNW